VRDDVEEKLRKKNEIIHPWWKEQKAVEIAIETAISGRVVH